MRRYPYRCSAYPQSPGSAASTSIEPAGGTKIPELSHGEETTAFGESHGCDCLSPFREAPNVGGSVGANLTEELCIRRPVFTDGARWRGRRLNAGEKGGIVERWQSV